eukprot:scaffold423_cov69-Phaeocystis_antarctica.AAC.4
MLGQSLTSEKPQGASETSPLITPSPPAPVTPVESTLQPGQMNTLSCNTTEFCMRRLALRARTTALPQP